jgi:hypothetical protein
MGRVHMLLGRVQRLRRVQVLSRVDGRVQGVRIQGVRVCKDIMQLRQDISDISLKRLLRNCPVCFGKQ